jgi:hypothetical protein
VLLALLMAIHPRILQSPTPASRRQPVPVKTRCKNKGDKVVKIAGPNQNIVSESRREAGLTDLLQLLDLALQYQQFLQFLAAVHFTIRKYDLKPVHSSMLLHVHRHIRKLNIYCTKLTYMMGSTTGCTKELMTAATHVARQTW